MFLINVLGFLFGFILYLSVGKMHRTHFSDLHKHETLEILVRPGLWMVIRVPLCLSSSLVRVCAGWVCIGAGMKLNESEVRFWTSPIH